MVHIAISIVNYNGTIDTLACLASLQRQVLDGIRLTVIVVDNGSEEPFPLESATKKNFSLQIIESKTNRGFSGGHNIAIRKAFSENPDYIMVLNNDTIADKNMIKELVKAIEDDNKIGAVSPKIYFAEGHEFHKDRYKEEELGNVLWYAGGKMDWRNIIGSHRGVDEVDHEQYDLKEETEFATGCCMLIRREVFEKVGLFDEKYFLYYEDKDLNERMRKAGYTVFYAPEARLWHVNAASSGGSGSFLQDYYITRNRMYFGMQYAGLRARVALLRESMRLLTTGRKWQKKGIQDYYLKKFGKGSFVV